MRDGKIDDLRDFTPQGLKRLEAWLEAWFRLRAGRGGGTTIDPATTVTDETGWGVAPAVGTDTNYAREGHTHGSPDEPVTSIKKTGASALTGDVTFSEGSGISLAQVGQDIAIAAAIPGFFGVPTQNVGYWYTCQFAKPGTSATPANGACHAIPFVVPVTTTYDRIGVYCTSGQTGANYRLGIYNDSNGYPGARVLDAGQVATTSGGEKTITISQQLTAGLYWLVAACQTSGSSATVAGGVIPYLFATSTTLATIAGATGNGGGGAAWVLSSVTGALPNPFTAGTSWISTGAAVTPFLRVASIP